MKKMLKGIATTDLIFAVYGIVSFSANAAHGCYTYRDSCHMVDVDGNDICHSYSFDHHNADTGYCLDADGNGFCDNCGFNRQGTETAYNYGYKASNDAAVSTETNYQNEPTSEYRYTDEQGSANE